MNAVLDAFWRSLVYCLHPKVMLWSLLPLVLMVGVTAGLGYFYLDGLLAWVTQLLESMDWLQMMWSWLESVGAGKLKTVLVPLIVILMLTPLVLVGCSVRGGHADGTHDRAIGRKAPLSHLGKGDRGLLFRQRRLGCHVCHRCLACADAVHAALAWCHPWC